tara:strand:+ start:22505 stop:23146 length:642 start_codon:yes stop_codon:yes gene_type:complete
MLNIISNIGRRGAVCKCSRCYIEYSIKDRYSAQKSRVGHLCDTCKTCVNKMGEITQEKLNKVFEYNPNTGVIKYKVDTLRNSKGDIATYNHTGGYENICINTKNYLAHRIIYMYMTGKMPEYIDHINHNRKDNKWSNLRNVTHLENNTNTSLSKNSSSNYNGISLIKSTGKYRAYINKDYNQIHLGVFNTIEEAKKVRDKANKEHNYHTNHGN